MAGATSTISLINKDNPMKDIASMAIIHVVNNMVMGNLVNRQMSPSFIKKGDEMTIKLPTRYTVTKNNLDLSAAKQDADQKSTTMSLDKTASVGVEFGVKDLSLTPEEFIREILHDPMIKIANEVDADLCALHKDLYYAAGPAGSSTLGFDDFVDARTHMQRYAMPAHDRRCVMGEKGYGNAAKNMKGLFLPSYTDDVVRKAQLGMTSGFSVFEDQNINTHTPGNTDQAWLVDDAGLAEGDTVIGVDTGAGTPAAGDIFTIADVNGVNPVSYADKGELMQFVVASYAAGDITFSPAIRTTGAYQNCVINSPSTNLASLDDNAVTFVAAHEANMCFTKNTFLLASAPLKELASLEMDTVSYKGVSMSFTRGGNIETLNELKRFDILYDVKTLYADHGCKLLG